MTPETNDPPAENPPHTVDSNSKPPAKGAEKMRLAAEEALKEHCLAIAKALVNSSIEGHIQSARFLYFLAAEQNEREAAEAVETLHSLALELAQQPEWSPPADENAAPTSNSDSTTSNPARDNPQPQG